MASDTLIKWHASAKVLKYSPEQVGISWDLLGHEPDAIELAVHHAEPADGIVTDEGNVLTTAGLNLITSLITGGGGQAGNLSNSFLGVSNGTGTAGVTDVALFGTGTGNAWFTQCAGGGGSVSQSNGVITLQATFGTTAGNFTWNDWGWVIAAGTLTNNVNTISSCGTGTIVLVNHKVTSLGTKASGSSWVFVATITLA